MGGAKKYDGYRSYSYLEPEVDYRVFDLAPEIERVPAYDLGLSDTERQRAERLLEDSVVISLHDHPTVYPRDVLETREYNRTARQHTGYEGLAASGMDAVFDNFQNGIACITSRMGWKWTDVLSDLGMRYSDLAKQDFVIRAESVADIIRAHETGRLALVPGLEAATMVENEVDRIDMLYGFGVRQMGIAYSETNALGSGMREEHDGGLTAFGARCVERMNKLGIAVDVSHSGDRTAVDVIRASRHPIFVTHAGAREVWGSKRMKPDEVLTACAERGGVIGIEAAPHTTMSRERDGQSIETVMQHFTYSADLVGIEHVAFGPDTMFGDHANLHRAFEDTLGVSKLTGDGDGSAPPRVDHVAGLENPSECFPNITGWLVQHGFSDDEIAAVLGGNVLRVLAEVWD